METEFSFNPEEQNDIENKEKEISPEDLGKQIKSYQVGDRFFAVGMVVEEKSTKKMGEIISMEKTHDPIFQMKKPTMSMITVRFPDGDEQEIRTSDSMPLYRGIPTIQDRIKEHLPEPQIPEEFKDKFAIKYEEKEFSLNEPVWIAGRIGTIAMILPGENPQVGVIAKNRKGHQRLFSVLPLQIEPIEYDSDGKIKN